MPNLLIAKEEYDGTSGPTKSGFSRNHTLSREGRYVISLWWAFGLGTCLTVARQRRNCPQWAHRTFPTFDAVPRQYGPQTQNAVMIGSYICMDREKCQAAIEEKCLAALLRMQNERV